MPFIGTCFRFYTQMRVQKKEKLLPIKLKTVYTTVDLYNPFIFLMKKNPSACNIGKMMIYLYAINFSMKYLTE